MYKYRSLPVFASKSAKIEDDVIKNIIIVQKGIDKVGDYMDDKFIRDIIKLGNAKTNGVKARFGHPNVCKDALGTFIGRYKNFRKIDGHAAADLHLDKVAMKSPDGDLYNYIKEMALKNPDVFGNSIVFMAESEDFELDGQRCCKLSIQSFEASDLVDSPAATDELFRSTDELGIQLTRFLDDNPSVFELLGNERLLKSFDARYKNYSKTKFGKTMSILAKVKNVFGVKQKNIDLTLAEGDILTVVTDNPEPAVGDAVLIEDSPAEDGTHLLADGREIVTEGGEITAINEPVEETEEVTVEEVQESVKSLETRLTKRIKELEDTVLFMSKNFKSEGKVPPNLTRGSQRATTTSKATFASKKMAGKI